MPHEDVRQIRDSLDSVNPEELKAAVQDAELEDIDPNAAPAVAGTAAEQMGEQLAQEDDGDDGDDEFKPITDIQIPQWLEIIGVMTGISGMLYKLEEERAKRAEEGWQNPYLEVEEVVMTMHFEGLVGFIIFCNCLTLGWEASLEKGEMAGFFGGCEHLFTIFFFIEWCMRMVAFGWIWAFEAANFADTCLVFGTGVLLKWFAEPMGFDTGALRILSALRILRLVRLARAMRLNPSFKEMWILIHGLTTSARPLLWTLVIAVSVLYVFAIAATEIIGKSPDFKDNDYAQELFGNFFRSLFTMVQLITMDTYCDLIIRPMMEVQPWLALFFVFFITVGVFIVMNLVTAIIVENAFAIVKDDSDSVAKEAELNKRHELKMLADLFFEIDLDGSGELSREEFFGSLKNKKVGQMLDLIEMKPAQLVEVWEVLDDGDGQLTIKEFTDGIRRMKGDAKAKDVADVIKKLRTTDKKHHDLKEQAQKYSDTLHELEKDAEEMAKNSEEVVSLFKEMYHRLTKHIERGEAEDKRRQMENARLAKMAEEEQEESEEEDGTEDSEEDGEHDEDEEF